MCKEFIVDLISHQLPPTCETEDFAFPPSQFLSQLPQKRLAVLKLETFRRKRKAKIWNREFIFLEFFRIPEIAALESLLQLEKKMELLSLLILRRAWKLKSSRSLLNLPASWIVAEAKTMTSFAKNRWETLEEPLQKGFGIVLLDTLSVRTADKNSVNMQNR